MSKQIVGQIMEGTKTVSDLKNLSLKELEAAKNSASSIMSRNKYDQIKYDKASSIKKEIQKVLDDLGGTKKQTAASWKVKPESELSLEELNNAIKYFQWYKSKYQPSQQEFMKQALSKAVPGSDVYNAAKKDLEKAPGIYAEAIKKEAYYKELKQKMYPDASSGKPKNSAEQQLEAVKTMLSELKATSKPNKNTQTLINALESIINGQ